MKHGLAGFADYEVIELLLTLAIPRSDVKQPAKALMARLTARCSTLWPFTTISNATLPSSSMQRQTSCASPAWV
jgi:DNA repair protein RadC